MWEIEWDVHNMLPHNLIPYLLLVASEELPLYSYDVDVVPVGAEAANPDVMRDLLDTVSTTATRASSIAGSLYELDSSVSRAGSVIGEPAPPRSHTFSFSEPCASDLDTEAGSAAVAEKVGVKFSFSEPLDTSQVRENV